MTEIKRDEDSPRSSRPAEYAGTEASHGELDLIALFALQRKHLRRTLAIGVAAFALTAIWSLVTKPLFEATSVLLIPQSNPSAASLAMQLASGLDLTGGGFEVYVDILKSRTVADRVIEKFKLVQVYKAPDLLAAERTLAARTAMKASKEGLVRIDVRDENADRAAAIANDYLAELDRMNQQMAITSAGQQRVYFEREMVKEKNTLADAEVALRQAQESSGVVMPAAEAQAGLTAIESTRAQIRLRQVELDGLLQGETERNPEVVRLRAELAGLESHLEAMQKSGGVIAGLPASKAPQQMLVYTRLAREVKFHEALFELLQKQFEIAKQQEAKTISLIEVLDPAIAATHKAWPPRTLYSLIGMIGGLFLGFFFTMGEAFYRTVLRNPDNRARYQKLMDAEAVDPHDAPTL